MRGTPAEGQHGSVSEPKRLRQWLSAGCWVPSGLRMGGSACHGVSELTWGEGSVLANSLVKGVRFLGDEEGTPVERWIGWDFRAPGEVRGMLM